MARYTNLIGQKFGKLTVVDDGGIKPIGKAIRKLWLCECECGRQKIIRADALSAGITKSCGCLQPKIASQKCKHGMRKTRFYKEYNTMKGRIGCKETHHSYKNYKGRGIEICDRWLGVDGFLRFKEDMYESYQTHIEEYGEKQTTLDRIDNDKGYCPDNCRWATYKEQIKNRRRFIIVYY